MTNRPPLEEADEDEFLPSLPTDPPQAPEETGAPLPRFPSSRRTKNGPPTPPTSPPSAPAAPTSPPADRPSDLISERSYPASTEPAFPPTAEPEPDLVPPEDLRAAVRQASDIAFVLVGQGLGAVHARVKGQPRYAERWVPTPTERQRVLDPASRIAARHITNNTVTADTIDGCLIAAGVGAFAMRAVFEVEPLPELEESD